MIILLGNMLFPHHSSLPIHEMPVFMAEDAQFCTQFRYHKHKLILVLAAMRHHRDRLTSQGYNVDYRTLNRKNFEVSYEDKLTSALNKHQPNTIHTYCIEDHSFQARLKTVCDRYNLKLHLHESPLFLTPHDDFLDYRNRYKRYFMADFYKLQRRRLNILLDEDQKPVGGKWSYDDQNREKLPSTLNVPAIASPQKTEHVKAVSILVDQLFLDHPGKSQDFWLPVTRAGAIEWMQQFFRERFAQFGPYEDALSSKEPFVFHSVLSPLLNLGLITPQEVLEQALEFAENHPIPLNSLEGFIRQLIGWREYIRGVYHVIGHKQRQCNFLQLDRDLTDAWTSGTTSLVPVDQVIHRLQKRGWGHHIERLMVMSNAMLLCDIHPDAVFRWFMEWFVDSADWVMVPNVYGMGQFADGGKIMTKPYISGSNYLRKMGDYPQGDWCEIWDGLYWRFIHKHQDVIRKNHRMAMMVKSLERMKSEKRDRLFCLAESFIQENTCRYTPPITH